MSRRPATDDDLLARFAVDDAGCWIWLGQINRQGYGLTPTFGRGARPAHRFFYERLVGPVVAGLELDHLCRVRCCVNPAHIEPVTHAENVRRGVSGDWQRRKTHCPAGHPYDETNTIQRKRGGRICRTCHNAATRARYHRDKAIEAAA